MPLNTRGHLTTETIDLMVLAALPKEERTQAQQHLESCLACRLRLSEFHDDKERFEKFVFARTLPRVEARLAAQQQKFWHRFSLRILISAVGLAVAVAAVLVLVFGARTPSRPDDYLGLKGNDEPSLDIFALRGAGEAFRVERDAELHPKDRIRFVVRPAGAPYVMVASLDGAGAFSVYHPFGAQRSGTLPPHRLKVDLPGAVELDQTLGTELLVAAFSNEPLRAEAVEAALTANPREPRLEGVRFVMVEFRKALP
jgi:hypothetical protein